MKKHIAILMMTAMLSTPAYSTGFPVIDIAALIKHVEEIEKQIQMIAQLRTQVQQAIATKEAITGQRFAWSSLLNSTDDKQMRRSLPANWQDIGQSIVAMNIYQQRVKDNYDTVKAQLYKAGTAAQIMPGQKQGSASLTLYEDAREQNAKNVAAMQSSYGIVNDRLQRIEMLIDKVGTTTDLKDSADLNNRIQSENALLMNDLARLQAAHYTAVAQKESRELQEDTLHKQFARGGYPSIEGKY